MLGFRLTGARGLPLSALPLNIGRSYAILRVSRQPHAPKGSCLNTPRVAFLICLALTPASAVEAADVFQACTARQVPVEHYTEGGLVEISADSGEAFIDESELVFFGNVEMLQEHRRLTADEIRYNQSSDTVTAEGNVRFQQPELIVAGDRAHLELERETAKIDQVSYELPGIGGRGTADSGETAGEGVFVAHRVRFTTCAEGDDSWTISARKLRVDRNSGQANASNARFRFKGVPLLATPWLQFPIDDRRMSGLLVPTAGYSSRNGFEVGLPYYLNLAPNYDATITPRIISKRGLLIGGEFRYLFPGHRGTLLGEMIPQDRLSDNDFRGAIHIDHRSNFTERLRGKLIYTSVSDDNYLEDFGRNIGVTSTRYLNNVADIRYLGDDWKALASWEQKEVLGTFDRPLTRFPQLLFTTDQRPTDFSRVSFVGEYVNFQRDRGISSQRIDVYPRLALQWRKPWAYAQPSLSGRYTKYAADDGVSGGTTEPHRTLFSASLDTGLFMERNLDLFGNSGIQSLEPRVKYLYTPYEDQSDIPNFDSILPDFNYANLFRENRFTGTDRIGDANQLAYGVSTRFMENASLRERFSAGIGQILYFSDRRVQLGNDPVETYATSPLVGELDLALSRLWSTNAVVQWNPTESGQENSLVRLRYHDTEARKLMTLGYRYYPSRNLEYSDIAFDWPITRKIRALGRWQYSTSFGQTMEAVGGLEYDTCCWRFRGALRRYIANADGEYDNSFFFQLELKGLSRLGHDIDEMFGRSLYGYDALDR